MRRHVRIHAVFPDAELPMRRHRVTIILLRMLPYSRSPITALKRSGDAFYDFGRTTIGAGLRPGDFRPNTNGHCIPMGHCDLDLSTRLRVAAQVRLGRFRAAHITVPPEISILIA